MHMLKSDLLPVFQNVTLFRNRGIAEVISYDEVIKMGPNPI